MFFFFNLTPLMCVQLKLRLTYRGVKNVVLSHQMVFFECLLSKSRRPFQFILTFCIRTEKVEQK